MPLPWPEAHVICGALVAADVVARALRLRPILLGLGHDVHFDRLVALTLVCDAACALTPYRAGGDAARVAALKRAGVPLSRAVTALVADACVTWPVVLAVGAPVGALGGATWWRALVGGVGRAGIGLRPPHVGLVVAFATGAAIGVFVTRWLKRRSPMRGVQRSACPRLSPRLLLATLPLTLVAVACRVLILPVLMSAMAEPSSFGGTMAGSFLLLYGQLLLPLPSGIGAVDVGLLAGAHESAGAVSLLVLWRLYTSGPGLVLGIAALPLVLRLPAVGPGRGGDSHLTRGHWGRASPGRAGSPGFPPVGIP